MRRALVSSVSRDVTFEPSRRPGKLVAGRHEVKLASQQGHGKETLCRGKDTGWLERRRPAEADERRADVALRILLSFAHGDAPADIDLCAGRETCLAGSDEGESSISLAPCVRCCRKHYAEQTNMIRCELRALAPSGRIATQTTRDTRCARHRGPGQSRLRC